MASVITKSAEAASWGGIAERIRNGYGIKVGTVVEDTLKNGKKFSVVAVHNDPYHRNEVAFVFTSCPFKSEMNETNTNAGGFKESLARNRLANFFDLLPDDLQAVIKKKKTVQVINGERVKCKDKLWIPTEYEMFGGSYYGEHTETDIVQFDYFKDRKNRMIPIDGEDGYGWVWLATPCASNAAYFCVVSNGGYAYSNGTSYAAGVAPGFIIR